MNSTSRPVELPAARSHSKSSHTLSVVSGPRVDLVYLTLLLILNKSSNRSPASMSQEELVFISPASSSATAPTHDPGDAQLLSLSLTKETLRDVALNKLAELRSFNTSLQRNNDNALRQVEDMRTMIQGMHGARDMAEAQQTRSTDLQPHHSTNSPSVNNQQAVKKPPMKIALPDKFTGVDKSPTISNWLFSISQYLRAMRADEEDYVVVATTFFTGTAMDWWQGVVKTEGQEAYHWSWQEFETRCLRRFQAVNDSELAFERLMRWRQTGSVSSYLAGFQSHIQQIPFTTLPEAGRTFVFIAGLNQELQKAVKMQQPTTLEQAMNLAQRASGLNQTSSQFNSSFNRPFNRQSSTMGRSSSQLHRTATGSRFSPLVVENVEEASEQVGRNAALKQSEEEGQTSDFDLECSALTAEQKKLYREGRCFKCKQKGHLGRDCCSNQQSKDNARM